MNIPRHYDQSRHLLRQDITLNHNSMKIHIKASKTDQYHQSAVVLISRTGTSTCPLNAMDEFLKQSNSRKSSPLFTFRNGKYLTRQDVSLMTKSLLYLVRANPALYSNHSTATELVQPLQLPQPAYQNHLYIYPNPWEIAEYCLQGLYSVIARDDFQRI